MTKLGHPNIIHVLRLSPLFNSPYYAIDMVFCEFTLADYIRGDQKLTPRELILRDFNRITNIDEKALQWYEISVIMKDICQGLYFIHSNREVHRDLKPSNSLSHIKPD